MKAVGYKKSLPVDAADALIDFETEKPEPRARDIRVAVKAISTNPVDYKVRKRAAPPEGETKILGYDAAGVVDAVGPDVTMFKAGDEVFYAGSIQRQGTNSEFHLVDERIVGRKPKTLSFAQAAALPLTSITAWELLFDRFGAVPGKSLDPRTLLIVGGAGGVGSILIQLARRLTGLTIVATAAAPLADGGCVLLQLRGLTQAAAFEERLDASADRAALAHLDDNVGELVGIHQPAQRVDRELELLPLRHRLLAAARRAGAGGGRLLLPVPGDVRGLPPEGPLGPAALHAGELTVLSGADPGAELAVVPTATAEAVLRWTVFTPGSLPPAPEPGLSDAEHGLRGAVRQAATTLVELDIARHRPGVRAEIADALEHRVRPPWPEGTPGRALRVLQQADEVEAILSAATTDEPGGALSASAAAARSAAPRPLSTAVRAAQRPGTAPQGEERKAGKVTCQRSA